jgi:hypothetical protein
VLQSSTILPELPDFISSMASLNWLYETWSKMTAMIQRPRYLTGHHALVSLLELEGRHKQAAALR